MLNPGHSEDGFSRKQRGSMTQPSHFDNFEKVLREKEQKMIKIFENSQRKALARVRKTFREVNRNFDPDLEQNSVGTLVTKDDFGRKWVKTSSRFPVCQVPYTSRKNGEGRDRSMPLNPVMNQSGLERNHSVLSAERVGASTEDPRKSVSTATTGISSFAIGQEPDRNCCTEEGISDGRELRAAKFRIFLEAESVERARSKLGRVKHPGKILLPRSGDSADSKELASDARPAGTQDSIPLSSCPFERFTGDVTIGADPETNYELVRNWLAGKQHELYTLMKSYEKELEKLKKVNTKKEKETDIIEVSINLPVLAKSASGAEHLPARRTSPDKDETVPSSQRKSFPKTIPQNDSRLSDGLGSAVRKIANLDSVSNARPVPSQGETDNSQWDLSACSICNRKFRINRLEKHEKACVLVTKKREVFDPVKMRTKGTEFEKYVSRWDLNTKLFVKQPGKRNWRKKHESFIQSIRYAREVCQLKAQGRDATVLLPPPPTENPDYIRCPYCTRRFHPATAERHIPKCKDTKARPAPPKKR